MYWLSRSDAKLLEETTELLCRNLGKYNVEFMSGELKCMKQLNCVISILSGLL